jgi:hypothetical protein
LTDCLEEIIENTKHKNPNVKLESMRFLIRCLRTTKEVPSKPEQKNIADSSGKLLTDTSAPMRDCAAEAMGTLMKIIGERAMNPYLEGLDDIRKTKIKEFFEAAQVKAKEKPKPIAPPPAAKAPPRKLGAKPGAKGPMKKAAPAAAPPPPVEEYAPPPAAKPAARAIPSKMAPKGGVGASRLVKKSVAAAPASPKRALPQEYAEEEPTPTAPPSRLGLGRGLANRPLSKEPAAAPAPVRVDPQIAIDKAELEELRAERAIWDKERREHIAERTKLMQEINDLQLQVDSPPFP